jgi:hypothetical protein
MVQILAFASLIPTAALAASAPPQLYGKSLRLTWSTTRTFSEMGATKTRSSAASMRVYISSKGRIFSEKDHESRGGGRGGGGGHRGGGGGRVVVGAQEVSGSGGNREVREWRAEGHSLVGYTTFAQGARRISVDFDPNFSACTLHITFAKQVGTDAIVQRHGLRVIQSIEVQSASCSIEAGNVFADQ